MAQPTRERLNELAEKWLNGNITPEERKLLNRWYDTDTGEPINWSGTDRSEEELQSRLLTNIKSGRNRIHVLPKRTWYIPAAAMVLISMSVGTWFYLSKKNKAQQKVQIANHIYPGGNKAVLTLGNGKKIILNDAANGIVAQQPGIKVIKTSNGQIIYAVAKTPTANAALAYHTIETPIGGQFQVMLPDGTKVWLDAATTLRYPERFEGKERKVELIAGEAYFEVIHNAKMPFRVVTHNHSVNDLGTHFNVMAYPDEKAIKTTLLEGSVKVSNANVSKLLVPGQQSQVTTAGINVVDGVDLEDVVAWKTGYFKFNENLESIMNKIARWYNVQIDYQFKPDPNLAFGGKISRSRDISEVLKIMEFTGKVHFKIDGRRIIVMQ